MKDSAQQLYQIRRANSLMIWDVYAELAKKHYEWDCRSHFTCHGFVQDYIPGDMTQQLIDAFYLCPIVPWSDTRPEGYSDNPYIDQEQLDTYDKLTIHRIMTPEMGVLLSHIFTELSPMIEQSLGHYWAVGAVRVYEAKPHVDGGYHSDAFPIPIKKIMIYPNGASEKLGSTELLLNTGERYVINGDPGLWVLFENTLIEHRAIGPKIDTPRPTIEVCILPAFRNDPEVRNHGIHVGYPWLPPDLSQDLKDRIEASLQAAMG